MSYPIQIVKLVGPEALPVRIGTLTVEAETEFDAALAATRMIPDALADRLFALVPGRAA